MLNLRITSHKTHEDYVAVQRNTGILPISGRHFVGIISVCVISIICATPVGNLVPLSIEAIPALASLNRGDSRNSEEAYLKSSDEEAAANLQITADAGSRENYDDADLPSNLFSAQAVNDAVAAARRSGNTAADAFNDEDGIDYAAEGEETTEAPAVPEQLRQRFYAAKPDEKASAAPEAKEARSEQSDQKALADAAPASGDEKAGAMESSAEDGSTLHASAADEDGSALHAGSAKESRAAAKVEEPGDEKAGEGQEALAANESGAPAADDEKPLPFPLKEPPLPLQDPAQRVMDLLADGSIPQVSGLDAGSAPSLLSDQAVPERRPSGRWYKQTVHSGDTISEIFDYLNLPSGTLADVTKAASKSDLYLKPGAQIHFLIDSKNNVLELVKPLRGRGEQVRLTRMSPSDPFTVVHESAGSHVANSSDLEKFADAGQMPAAIEAAKDRKAAEEEAAKQKKAEELLARQNATTRPRLVISSLKRGEGFNAAAKRAGLTAANISQLRSVLSGRVNLRRMATGDDFRVLFNGVGTKSAITAVEFNTSRNGRVRLFKNPDNGSFYEEDGYKPQTGSFRRFPVNGNLEVSSPFNPRRYHPLRHRISPHNGVDFRMPIGTPVYAPSDGVVTYAGYMRGGGYTVVIKHMGAYSTVYMHLSRFFVSKGDTVHMGQVFAKSGNTGGSTGSHLHYEIRINDRPVDPLKIDLPSGSPAVASQRRERFQSTVKVLKSELYKESLAIRQGGDQQQKRN
ncbi:MAG: peptidoglycan DD-metalloendopeptidase family protein [Succinivibrio sp.]|nr:peptidoglycan DD-metalloendopeptidase family protein [Succinivibrio sp.]